jgi:predicted membrane protein
MNKMSSPPNKINPSVVFGLLIVSSGLLYILRQFKLVSFDIALWPLFFIAGGILSGMKNGFNRLWPIFWIFIGVYNLIPDFKIGDVRSDQLFWPVLLIMGGILIVMRGKRKEENWIGQREELAKKFFNINEEAHSESFVNIEAFFGGRKEIITSKQFSGCNATAICGGAEINLMQADNTLQPMVIDLRVVFGGIEIVVPSHWEIINEVDVLFGGIEDKRNLRMASDASDAKKLLLRGSVTFGGLELKSY